VIYALEMFEYAQDPETCLKNFGDALRPDGILMLEFPNYPPERSPGIAFFRKRKELETLLRAANFRSWEINALRLRPWTGLLFKLFHEQPLQVYRLWRDRRTSGKPMIYEQTWAFQNKDRLTPSKIVLHLAWSILFAWMRLGGDCFERIPLGDEIENYDLLVIGRR
jgi:SAM-dependent methyltransferase